MKKEVKNINVGKLVEEINTSVTEGEVLTIEEVKTPVKKREYEYTLLFSNGPDFALNRKTQKTNKTLVSIFTQGILYIYDELSDEKIEIDEKCPEIKSFFGDKKADVLIIEPKVLPYAKNGILKSDLAQWYNFVTMKHPGIRFLIKRNLFDFSLYKSRYRDYDISDNPINKLYLENKNILISIFTDFGPFRNLYDCYKIVTIVLEVLRVSDPDTTRYFLEKLNASSVELREPFSLENAAKYNVDIRRLTDYLLFDLYKQGKTSVGTVTYNDYLEQSAEYYGKVKEKYPKSLDTAHQIISKKVREKARMGEGFSLFEEIMSESEDFSYHNNIDKFLIRMPEKAIELIDEGEYLCHCVASYVEKVNNGDCTVVFMRKSEEPDVPYLTIEILPDRSVPQVEGMNKRSELTEDEIKFIKNWTKRKHLKITAENVLNK